MYPFHEDFCILRKQTANFDLAVTFFLVFSRFEYALKRAGFTNTQKAEADWEKFCSKYKEGFSITTPPGDSLQNNYLLQNPPKKQVIDKGSLAWETTKYQEEPVIFTFSRYVRRVRNNLFHGEKFRMILEDNSPRNVELVIASLQVLSVFLELDKGVKGYFYLGIR